MSNLKCDGECSRENRCKGDVRSVLVLGNGFTEEFQFNYCETAIQEDREHGFDVAVVPVERDRLTPEFIRIFMNRSVAIRKTSSLFSFKGVDAKLVTRTDGEFLEVHIYDDQNKDMICVSARVEDVEYFKHQKDSEQ
jgi:hypothetical protein